MAVVDDKQLAPDEPLAAVEHYEDKKGTTWYVVAEFTAGGMAYAQLNSTALVRSIRIVVHTEATTWAILSEAWIRLMPV